MAVLAGGHPEVVAAGAEVLGAGGNAFDAVVAAGLAAAVLEPTLTSLGGGGFCLARPAAGEAAVVDFFVDTPGRGLPERRLEPHFFPVTVRFPGSDQVFNVGLGSVAVPGCLAGYAHVHGRLGRLPLAAVVAPAARLAADGVVVTPVHAALFRLLEPILTLNPACRRLFAPAGRLLTVGERLRNPELGAFLAELPAHGGQRLYRGDLATVVAGDMARGGGLVTEADLAAYEVVERPPLTAAYRAHQLLTNPPPSLGGSLLALSLQLLESAPAAGWGTPPWAEAMVEAMVAADDARAGAGQPLRPRATRGTTHVSVADDEGNVASMTTSNGETSGYVVPGTGILLNNMLGEDDLHPHGFHAAPPGQRVASMMAPSVLLASDGQVRLVLGTGGSKRIRAALLQVISAVVDGGLDVGDAVGRPRLHWDGQVVQAEPGFPEPTLDALRRRWPVHVWGERNLYFGGVHAVVPSRVGADGGAGAGDPRRGGAAATV